MHDDDEEPSGPVRPNFGAARPGGAGRAGTARVMRGGGGGPSMRLWAFGAIVVLILLFGAGLLEFWTDAIWYRSVGFDGVFWTRIGAGAGLFLGVTALGLIVFLGNLWLARRLAPPMEGVPGTFRDLFERLAESPKPVIAAISGYCPAAGSTWRWPATCAWPRLTPFSAISAPPWAS